VHQQNIQETNFFWHSNKAINKNIPDRVHRDKKSECHDHKDLEGKTPGSILCGLVLAQECALLEIFHINDMMQNPEGRVG
jgi:hypothetical protein